MVNQFKISSKYIGNLEVNLQKNLNRAVRVLKEDIDSKTPEDTKELLENNRIIPAVKTSNGVVASVVNDTEYAFLVETGVQNKIYNYHKPKGSTFYKGVGARMFTRAFFETQSLILKILNE